MTITAHAGAMGTKDNSLESVKVGIENAEIIEIDLRFNSEGVPVLTHNSAKGGEMTLDELFELVSKSEKTKVNIDLKEFDGLSAVDELAEKRGVTDRVFYTGVFPSVAEKVKKQSRVPFYLNFNILPLFRNNTAYIMSLIGKLRRHGAIGANCNFRNAGEKFIRLIQEHGFEVSLWTVNGEDDIRKVVARQPDNITSRNPDLVKRILDEQKA